MIIDLENGCIWSYLIKKKGLLAGNHNDLRKLDNSKQEPADKT